MKHLLCVLVLVGVAVAQCSNYNQTYMEMLLRHIQTLRSAESQWPGLWKPA
jgi:hypothetical protein